MKDFFKKLCKKRKMCKKWKLFSKNAKICEIYIKYLKYLDARFLIKNLQKSIDYILKSCKDMQIFTSSYEIGLQVGNE